MDVVLELESYGKGVAVFAATGAPYGRVAIELRDRPWRELGNPVRIRVTVWPEGSE